MTLIVIGLTFKLMIIDSLFKDEIRDHQSCSMFLSTFVPDYFIAIGYACLMLKAVFIIINFKDTKESYQEENKERMKKANKWLLGYSAVLTCVMFLRYFNTCERQKIGKRIDTGALSFIMQRSRTVSVFIALKIIPLLVFMGALLILSRKPFFTRIKALPLYFTSFMILIYSVFNIFNISRLSLSTEDPYVMFTCFSDFVAPFFTDIILIADFMFIVLILR